MKLKIRLGKSGALSGIRAVLAEEDIKKGETIEVCPVVLIPMSEINNVEKTVMTKYEFQWDEDNEALVLGYGSLYNHSFEANIEYELDLENKTMIFKAKRDITTGEELFIDYMDGGEGEEIPPEYLDLKH